MKNKQLCIFSRRRFAALAVGALAAPICLADLPGSSRRRRPTPWRIKMSEIALEPLPYAENALEPVITATHYATGDYYVLYNNEFHSILDNASKVPACKAVLKRPAGVSATRGLTIVGGDGTTSLRGVESGETVDEAWYTSSGLRFDAPTKKGLYIRNGKKIIVK
jgi:hypothetical protein